MKKLIDKLFEEGKSMGFTNMEVITSESNAFEVKIYKQEIDSYKVTDSKGMGFRGDFEGQIGYSYTEKLADDSIEILLREAKQNAQINDNKDKDEIFAGSSEYKKVDNYFPDLDKIEIREKIDFALKMEEIAKSLDPRVKSTPYCVFGSGSSKGSLVNSLGLDLEDKSNGVYCFLQVLAQDKEDLSDGFAYCFEKDFSLFDPEKIAKEAVDKAISFLGTKPIKSNEYKAIILNEVSSDILATVNSCFSARAVQKGLSYMKGKLNTEVASDKVTLVDDPFLPGQSGTSSFDGEGVATKYKEVISKGVLKTYLHNNKTAKIDKVESTGNASRSVKSTIGITPTNLFFKKGEKSLKELEELMGDGIVITDVSALHSGFNSISGDFSLPAKGYTIKDGKKDKYFRQVTIAGNYFDLLKDIEEVGEDLTFGSNGNIGSPSLYIKKISLAGE